MTQNGVSAFARLARWFAASAVLLLVSAGALAAQTGKIEGRVRDQAGAPIANAQVTIVGSAFSALTNPQGYYFINNVPAGTVALRASFIGYKRTEVTGVRVLAGQTSTQDIQIEASPVVIEELTVVAAENPLVPRDEVTTKQRIDGAFTEKLPVDRINNVLLLQPGVVASAGGANLSIRGGRTDEAATYVDGVPVQSGQRGGGFVGRGGQGVSGNANTVGTNQFEQISVTTGAASAEQGNAQSGIVNLSTITGGSRFAGRLAMESDEMFPNTSSLGYNRVEGNLSGPLGLKGLSFALGAALEGQRFGYTDTYTGNPGTGIGRENHPLFVDAGVDEEAGELPVAFGEDGEPTEFATIRKFAVFTGRCDDFAGSANADIANNYGEDCNGARTPNNSGSAYQVSGNINYSYGNGSRLRFSALASQNQGRNFSNGLQLNLLGTLNGTQVQNQVFTVNWTQNLTRSTERALALDAAFSYQRDRGINSPVADGGPGTGTLGFYVKDIPLQYGFDFLDEPQTGVNGQPQSRLDCYVLSQSCYAPIDQDDPQAQLDNQFKTDIRQNPYGLLNSTFPYAGGPTARMDLAKEDRFIGRAALDWQVDRYNRLRIGGEYTQYDITSYSTQILNPIFSDYYTGKPRRAGAFVEDRLDLGDVVVQAGLRYDWYDSRASRPCFGLDANGDAVSCRTFDGNGTAVDNTALVSGTEYFFPRVSTNAALEGVAGADPTALYVADKSHDYISPRIQVAFPVTEKTNFRLSYAHQVQTPDFALIYGGINTDLSSTNTNHVFGSDLDFGKTITFEFGIRHAFSDDFVLDIAAYNKDNLANAAGRLVSTLDPLFGTSVDIRQITNADFGNTRGIDVRVDKRFGQLFNGTLGYSFQSANSTGTDPFTYINFGSRVVNQLSGGNQPPPQATAPLALSRPHNLVGAFALTFPNGWNKGTTLGSIFQNFSTFLSFRVSSGTAYTECGVAEGNQAVLSGGVCARGGFVDGLNSARLPTFKTLDMRFVKGFGLGRNQLSLYLDARNILNFQNVLQEFVVTKDIVSPLEQEQNWQADSSVFFNEADANNAFEDDGSVDLTFSGATNRVQACGTWVDQAGSPAALNCAYMVRAEERWGNGDGVFSSAEQRRVSDALYFANGRGENFFYGQGARFRLGVEFNF